VIVVDPRRIELRRLCVLHPAQKPAQTWLCLTRMIQAIISNGWLNKAFIDERTEGFDALAESVMVVPRLTVEKITGVPAGDIGRRTLLHNQRIQASCTHGITQHVTGTNNVLALGNLAMSQVKSQTILSVNPLRAK